jgi:hypothetical protein
MTDARADVDWAAGMVTARGVGPADLRAPGPDIARVGAERVALERGRAELVKSLRAIPLAAGGTLGARHEEAIAGLVDKTTPERTLYSDGSVVLRFELPLARVAEAVLGTPPADAETRPLVVLPGSKVKIKPALGYRVRAGDTVRDAPVAFGPAPPGGALEARATSIKDGVIALDLDTEALAGPKSLAVHVVWSKP